MHQSFELPPGDTWGIHFYCQWNAVKTPPYGEKIQSDLPLPNNIW